VGRKRLEPVLAYATNCYAGESFEELTRALRNEVSAVREHLGGTQSVGVSLRIGMVQAAEIAADPGLIEELRAALDDAGAVVVGANAFPISAPVDGVYKDEIYNPDWQDSDRLDATLQIAQAVAPLVAEGQRAVLTTMTGTCRLWPEGESIETEEACVENLQLCAEGLERISAETGRDLVLGLEPEPFTTAETTFECVAYFQEGLFEGQRGEVARRRLGVNLDLAHCAVMFEDPAECMSVFKKEGISLFGLHVSAALKVEKPGERLASLREFDEPVYLHQVTAVDAARNIGFRCMDLDEFLALPAREMDRLAEARVHFHVPVYADQIGGLATTSEVTWEGVRAARNKKYTDLFVVETYTWPQVAGKDGAAQSVAEGIARELKKTAEVLGA
jgi:sugar phosphate isomerase/epimerase